MKQKLFRQLLTLCGLIFALGVSADGLYISNFNTLPNTATTVSVNMKNTNVMSGFQFDLALPSGVTLNSVTASSARTSFTYTVSQKTMSDGSIRILCVSQNAASAVYTGTDGEVLKLSLTSTGTGDKTITLKNQVLTESDLDELEPSDATATMHVHALTATAAKAATCTTAGNSAYWYCSGCKKYYSNSTATTETTLAAVTIAALGHSYGTTPTWAWTGTTACTGTLTCTRDNSHTTSANATITSAVKTAATCEVKGTTTYTAKATINGTSYTTTKDVQDIAALGHSYGTPTWTWSNDGKTASAKITCTHDANHTLSGNATVTSAVKTAATCEAKGTTTYTAKVTLNNTEYTSTKDVQDIAALGHSYGTPTWTWSNDGKTASAKITCTRDASHTLSGNATITSAVKTAATCTVKGTTTYTAKVTLNSTEYTSTKDVQDIAALGHSYGTPAWTWGNDGKTASAKITCTHDASHTLSGNATVTSAVKTAATCEAKGTTTYTAKVTLNSTEYTSTKDVQDIAALGHSYGTPTWTWTGLTAATASFACSKGDDTQSVTATITNAVTTAATDTKAGVRTYTATVTFGGKTYTDTKTEEIAATGHTYSTTPTWTWDGYTSATAAFTCTSNDDTQTVTATITKAVTTAATCTATGVRTYTAKVTFQGKDYTNTKTETIAATGHNYGEVVWTWTGYTAAKATRTCANDASHVLSADGTITSAVTTAATCTNTGIRTYTATAILDGSSYINKVTETIAATGHSYGDPSWTWSEDGKTANVKFTCASGDDTQTVNATITSAVKTAATCTVKGTTTYTAKATFNGVEYTDTKDVQDIEALGHDYQYADNGDGTHKVTCSCCDYTANEAHTFTNGTCEKCGAAEKEEDTDISGIDNVVYIENIEATKGSQVSLSLKMKNTVSAQGFQCDVYLPAGATFAKDADGFYLATLSTARTTATKTNYFDCALQSDGALRILCNSTKGYTFSGNDGEVATIVVNIGNDIDEGDYPIYIKKIEISDNASQSYKQSYIKSTLTIKSYTIGDANNDGSITVTDFTAVANAILGNPPASYVEKAADVNRDNSVTVSDLTGIANIILYGSITGASGAKALHTSSNITPSVYIPSFTIQSGSNVNVPVYINNATTSFSAYQMDIVLPEGLKVTDAYIVNDRISDHVLQSAEMEDGSFRLLSYSVKNNSFLGSGGVVAMLTISAENIANGEYTGEVNNIELSENANAYNINAVKLNFKVGEATGITNVNSEQDTNAIYYNISGIQSNTLHKGINIIRYNDGTVEKSIIK